MQTKENIFYRTKDAAARQKASSSSAPLSKFQLKAALNSFRTQVASRDDVPVYCVLTNASVESLVEAMPLSERDLLGIKGFGPAKVS